MKKVFCVMVSESMKGFNIQFIYLLYYQLQESLLLQKNEKKNNLILRIYFSKT